MNYLIAKIKGARGQYFKVLSDADAYTHYLRI